MVPFQRSRGVLSSNSRTSAHWASQRSPILCWQDEEAKLASCPPSYGDNLGDCPIVTLLLVYPKGIGQDGGDHEGPTDAMLPGDALHLLVNLLQNARRQRFSPTGYGLLAADLLGAFHASFASIWRFLAIFRAFLANRFFPAGVWVQW